MNYREIEEEYRKEVEDAQVWRMKREELIMAEHKAEKQNIIAERNLALDALADKLIVLNDSLLREKRKWLELRAIGNPREVLDAEKEWESTKTFVENERIRNAQNRRTAQDEYIEGIERCNEALNVALKTIRAEYKSRVEVAHKSLDAKIEAYREWKKWKKES